MQSSLDNADFLFSKGDILERVDEYTLYCHYLEYEPQFGIKYTSPIRTEAGDYDDNPSFGIFHSRTRSDVEYMWKDQGKGIHGDIFDLVRILFSLKTHYESVEKIAADFGLINKQIEAIRIPVVVPQPQKEFRIRVKSRPLDGRDMLYWNRYNINKDLLDHYHVTAIQAYWMTADQDTPKFPRTPGYAYRLWDRYKLYFPFEPKDFKFRNNLNETHLEGFTQLRFNSDLLVITKAMKDVMFMRSIGIEAVAPRGEHTMIEGEHMRLFLERYKHVVTFMDNDGKNKAPEYKTQYGIPLVQLPLSCGQKDPTDHCHAYGAEMTEQVVLNLIYEQIRTGSFIRSYL